MRIIRKTTYCPITGSSLTKVYKKTCFRYKIIIQYRMVLTEKRTIGFKESYLGLPSVAEAYGKVLGFTYIQKREL